MEEKYEHYKGVLKTAEKNLSQEEYGSFLDLCRTYFISSVKIGRSKTDLPLEKQEREMSEKGLVSILQKIPIEKEEVHDIAEGICSVIYAERSR